jgi:hypothetical protein
VVTRYSYQGGKSFEGSAPSRMEQPPPSGLRANEERPHQKHGESHGRLQGAIDLQGVERSKPSESGGTARTERVRRLAPPGRRSGLGRPGSGRTAFVSAEGRSLNPKRGVQTGPPRPSGPGGEERTARTGTLSSKERHGHELRLVVVPTHQPTGIRPLLLRHKERNPTGKSKRPAGRPADSGKARASAPTDPLTNSDQANSRKAAPDCKERSRPGS